MITALLFGCLAAIAAVMRALAGRFGNRPAGFAFGTLGVNLLGSFTLGVCSNLAAPELTVIGVGFIGTLTTFSSFARDTVALVELRKLILASCYLLTTIAGSIALAALGIAISAVITP